MRDTLNKWIENLKQRRFQKIIFQKKFWFGIKISELELRNSRYQAAVKFIDEKNIDKRLVKPRGIFIFLKLMLNHF